MFETIANVFRVADLRSRILFTLAMVGVFRLGIFVPAPGVNREALTEFFSASQGSLLGLYDMFTGGAMSQFSVFTLGIMPYISSSIIMQMMGYVIPALESLKKEGEAGRRKTTQYTRYATVALAVFQSFGIAVALEGTAGLVINPGMGFKLTTVISLTAGTMFLMWLGEQITERGLGNGISILIFGGIAAGLPSAIGGLFELVRTGAMSIPAAIFIVALVVLVTYFVVFVERDRKSVV